MDQNFKHIIIEGVAPSVDDGRYPAKRIAGEPCLVEADIFRDGHQIIRAAVKYRRKSEEGFDESPMVLIDNDRWRGQFLPKQNSRYVFTIEAWTDLFHSWLDDFGKKVQADRDVRSDLLEGITLLEQIAQRSPAAEQIRLGRCISQLRATRAYRDALELVAQPEVVQIAERYGERAGLVHYEPLLEIVADRPKARFSAWYEMFPRSQSDVKGKASTLLEAERRLPAISDMGFDVVYLPPIHPIGVTNRKGPNNSLNGGGGSPGSPWAIGNAAGGHDAVEPTLGTLEDFRHFVATANRLGLETALDFAVQCSPDHPWVTEHPEWFKHRPDGTIRYAENPPKEYQDIYPLDFDTGEQAALSRELLRIVQFWMSNGVTIFRVDNPHTKPVAFWEWLISTVQSEHPEVLFLAEAFTHPKMMKALAKAGFSQSYSYFTWRNTKAELIDYLTELTASPIREYYRPNFFTNTPDILSGILQAGGPPAFKLRLVLAATLASSYGIYSGFELCERAAIPGTEEPLDSEKYEIKFRDWDQPGNIREFLTRVNEIRRANAALHDFLNVQFLLTDNDQILFYVKTTPQKDNVILVAVNLDPLNTHYCTVSVPAEAVGVRPGQSFHVTDLLTGTIYTWSERNFVRLDPNVQPAHILRVDARL
jgi:starch synthase (maltosyl-transferring)